VPDVKSAGSSPNAIACRNRAKAAECQSLGDQFDRLAVGTGAEDVAAQRLLFTVEEGAEAYVIAALASRDSADN
jgi:hypothetical protein